MHQDKFNWGKVESEILTVNRGTCSSEGERITKVWNQVLAGKIKDTEFPALIRKIKDSKWNYGGTFYSVYFRVDKRILLQEVGFFGPFAEAKASYFVHVEIFKPKDKEQAMPNSWESPRIAKKKLDILAKKDELFYVNFVDGVSIEPFTWYLVQFKLDGPNTLRSEACSSIVTVDGGEHGIITFEFNKGSFQMPSLKFQVMNPNDGRIGGTQIMFHKTNEID